MIKTKHQDSGKNLNSDRPKSLNPLIYPTWWGDDDAAGESEPQVIRRTKEDQNKNTF